MKKCLILILIILIFLSIHGLWAKEEIKYVESKMELFGIRITHPDGWKQEVKADNIVFTSPSDPDLQLVYLEGQEVFKGSLDELLSEYKKELEERKDTTIISTKPFDICGHGAYYVRLTTPRKDIGNIIFNMKDKIFGLALKTKKGSYNESEPILMKAAETLKLN
jgi:hypothetical protein